MKKNGRLLDHPDFAAFWAVWPKKVAKQDAEKAWQQMTPPLADVLTALVWQTLQPGWVKDGGAFIPYPASWLRGRRWEDEPFHVQLTPPPQSWCLHIPTCRGEQGHRRKLAIERGEISA